MLREERTGQGLDTLRRGVGAEKSLGLSLDFVGDSFDGGKEAGLTLLGAGMLPEETQETEKFVASGNERRGDLDDVRSEGSRSVEGEDLPGCRETSAHGSEHTCCYPACRICIQQRHQ